MQLSSQHWCGSTNHGSNEAMVMGGNSQKIHNTHRIDTYKLREIQKLSNICVLLAVGMADCIPFSTWTVTAREVSSLTLVSHLSHAHLDKTRRIPLDTLMSESESASAPKIQIATEPERDIKASNRRDRHPLLMRQSVFGIARAGAETPHVSIAFQPVRHGMTDPFVYLKRLQRHRHRLSKRRRRSTINFQETAMLPYLDGRVVGIKQWLKTLQLVVQKSMEALWTLFKVVLPLAWIIYTATPLSNFSVGAKVAVSSAISLPWLGDFVSQHKTVIHHHIRDSGMFKTLMDTLFLLGLPSLVRKHPSMLLDLVRLRAHRTRIQYGDKSPKSQIVDVYFPATSKKKLRGMIFFVHGGAWGSGSPSQYALVAKPFLERGVAVAVVGYRLYPEADVLGQVQDLELACAELARHYPQLCQEPSELGIIGIGHSSGAHIMFLMLVERLRQYMESERWGFSLKRADHPLMKISSFIGISGPYDIARHYEFEAAHGLEQLSPMHPACGGKGQFHRHSPVLQLSQFLARCSEEEIEMLDKRVPRIILVHGESDATVPVSSSQAAFNKLRSVRVTKCEAIYLPEVGHAETVMELMLGGPSQDTVLEWIEATAKSVAPLTNVPISVEEIFKNAMPIF